MAGCVWIGVGEEWKQVVLVRVSWSACRLIMSTKVFVYNCNTLCRYEYKFFFSRYKSSLTWDHFIETTFDCQFICKPFLKDFLLQTTTWVCFEVKIFFDFTIIISC